MMAKSGNIHCLSGGREYNFDCPKIGNDLVADNEVVIILSNRAYIDGLVQERRNSSV